MVDEQEKIVEPIQSDLTEALPLDRQLDVMSKVEMIKYADTLGYQVDDKLTRKVIKENILRIVSDRKSQGQKLNEESLAAVVSEADPEISVRFFNMESPGADLEFAYSDPRGMRGPNNPNGFKKCPVYHLFPGEVVKLAYSVYEHLTSLTFTTHKTVWDTATGNIKGNIPIVKPRFILQPVLTKEQLIKLNE